MINRLIASGIIPICLNFTVGSFTAACAKTRNQERPVDICSWGQDYPRLLTMCPPAIGTMGMGRDKGGEIPATFRVPFLTTWK